MAATLDVRVQGVDGAIKENIVNRLTVVKKSLGEQPTATQSAQYYQDIPDNIHKAMEPFGYFQPNIIHYDFHQQGQNWLIDIVVEPGPATIITHLDIQILGPGQHQNIFTQLLDNFPIKTGDVFTTERYERAKRLLFTTAHNNGYLDANLNKRELYINRNLNTAEVTLYLETGEQYFFGAIHFEDPPLSEDFLQRYVKFSPGQPYSTAAIIKLQDDLSNSGYFQRVKIDPKINQTQDQYVPIDIIMTPAKSQTYTFGVGYSTDVQLRGTVGIDLTRLNDYGHRFNALIQASSVENNLQAQYLIPGADPLTEQYSIAASIFNLDYDNLISGNNVTSRAAKISGGYVKSFGDWQQIISMNLLYESFVIPPNPRRHAFIPYPSITWNKTTADDIFFPTEGYTFRINLLGATKALLSDVDFAQIEVDGKYIYSLTKKTRTIFRGALGYTAIDDINTLPPSLQFYTGGIQSVRGYRYQSIGPGKFLVNGSAELQQEIIDKWYASVFYDVGDVFNCSSELDLKRSWGVGLIRETVVGPVRIGVAQALDLNNKPFRLVFSIGPDL